MTETANNTTISPNFITDSTNIQWGISPPGSQGAQVARNGVIDTSTLNVASLLYVNHTVYHQNTSGNFFVYKNPGWSQVSDPRVAESAQGTTVSTVGPAIINSSGEKWTLVQSSSGLQ